MRYLFFLLTFFSFAEATACKFAPSYYDFDAFLAERKTGTVVFTAQVTSVRKSSDGKTQEITLKARKWWRGYARANVLAIGQQGTMPGTSCEGAFDFKTHAGAELFVVGEESNGKIYPSGQLSLELENGSVPAKLLASLSRQHE